MEKIFFDLWISLSIQGIEQTEPTFAEYWDMREAEHTQDISHLLPEKSL